MPKIKGRLVAVFLLLTLVAAACGDDGGGGDDSSAPATTGAPLDYEALGLWDDGPCDESRPPLKIGLMTVFESPLVSLEDQATALEVSAEAFNQRGGANGACIEVHTCDDGANIDQAVACAREVDDAGVVATVNDQGTAGQAEVSAYMADAGIPRVAGNVTQDDWDDQNAYPLDASGTGGVFVHPNALIQAGVTNLGIIRVDLPAASALIGLLQDVYEDDGADFVYDTPVPAGTTDYTQFILGAEDAGADGVTIALGEQEAIQVIRAAQQLGSDLKIAGGLGTFSQAAVADLGDIAQQMEFTNAYPPATFDLPVYEAMRQDLAASGDDALQPENLKASPMRSWIGLYALLYMIRDTGMTDFTREGMTQMLDQAHDVPMLDIFGGEDWTPDTDHPGIYKRAGVNHFAVYEWDPDAESPTGVDGNFVEASTFSFDDVLCGSPFGAPAAEC